MYSLIHSAVVYGVSGLAVDIETKISRGLPSYNIVGLPNTTIKESKERIRAAIESLDMNFPARRITLNLIPAEIKKDGSHLDLPMAVGILCALQNKDSKFYNDMAFFGELSLDGRLLGSPGLLPMIFSLMEDGINKFVIPKDMEAEISYVPNIEYISVGCIKDIYELLAADNRIEFTISREININHDFIKPNIDFADIVGQQVAKRALMISACGGHSILLSGPPGSGKSMMVEALYGIMPKLTSEEFLDVQKVYSVLSNKGDRDIWFDRPFRKPHQNITGVAMIGGGNKPSPGEVSLAHRGILFLDEITEFNQYVLESLRQPLEMGEVLISRSKGQLQMPAQIILVATMNPCKCGYLYSEDKECTCSDAQIRRYLGRLSGPILNRIDILIEVQRVKLSDEKDKGISSSQIYEKVKTCFEIQQNRFKQNKIVFNSQMSTADINKYCQISSEANKLLQYSSEHFRLARGLNIN